MNNTAKIDAYRVEIDSYIQDEKENAVEALYRKVFKVQSNDRLEINEKTWSGFGPMVQVGESGNAVDDEPTDGYEFAYQVKNFRKKTTFSSDLLETDQTGAVEGMARSFAQASDYSRNLYSFGMFRNAFNSAYSYGDSKPLISLSHPMKSGTGTQGNTFADGVQLPLSYDNALRLQDVMLSVLSGSGNLMNIGGEGRNKVLFGSQYLREELKQIAGVTAPDKEPDTTDNNTNYFKGANFDVLIIPWLSWEAATQAGDTSVAKTAATNIWDTMWGILDMPTCMRYFKLYERTGYPKQDQDVTKDNQALNYYLYDKYVWGNTHWMPVAMSKGDSSTYTG